MTNRQLISSLAKTTGLSTIEASDLLTSCVEQILTEVAEGNSVAMLGFGAFELREKQARRMYNPTTKDYFEIPSRQVLGFRPSVLLKTKINS